MEFFDTDAGDVLTYQLSAATINNLNTSDIAGNWSFDNSTGQLIINTPTLTADDAFLIEIVARDLAGDINAGGFAQYGFQLVQATNPVAGANVIAIDAPQSGNVYSADGANQIFNIGLSTTANAAEIFSGGGDDTVTIFGSVNGYINLGDGNNTVIVNSGSGNFDNQIVGGFDRDTIQLDNVYNEVFAMDGDDVIRINLGGGTNALTDLTNAAPATSIFIDGGHDNLVQGAPQPDGRGDTLVLEGSAVSIDFTVIDDNYIRGIERLDLSNAPGMTINLGLNDVIEMTDSHNKLIIRADDDILNFVAGEFAGFVQTANDVTLDDDLGGGALTNFDVYMDSNGTTLLIEDTGASINGLP